MFLNSIKLFSFILCLLLSACVTIQAPPTQQPLRIGLKLSPASFGQTLSLQQHLTVERAGSINTLDVALDIDPQQVNLVGLAMGQRVMSLHYDGKDLQVWRNPHLPKQVRGEDVLEDLELTLWPIAAIQKALPPGWQISEQGMQRTLFFDTIPIMEIQYSTKQHWQGTIVLTNLRYHYRLTIQSVVAQ